MGELTPLDHVFDARQCYRMLFRDYLAWLGAGGLEITAERDPEFVRCRWTACMSSEPASDLSSMAVMVIDLLLSALHSFAECLHRAGNGDRGSSSAVRVEFPLTHDVAAWDTERRRCVPFIAPWGAARLRSLQPFASTNESARTLASLCALSDGGRPRPLDVYALASFPDTDGVKSGQGSFPSVEVFDPVLPLALGVSAEVACVYVTMGRDHEGLPQLPVPWWSGFRLDDPPRPHVELVFRTRDGAQLRLNDIKGLIIQVGRIVEGFGPPVNEG